MKHSSNTTHLESKEDSSRVMKLELTRAEGGTYVIAHTVPNLDGTQFVEMAQNAGTQPQLLSSLDNEDGSHLIMLRVNEKTQALVDKLNSYGSSLAEPAPEKEGFNPWKWRGITSIVGQSLQIASSLTSGGSASDRNAIFGFATLNLAANICNMTFGGQHNPDTHQLTALKEQFNQAIAPFVENPNELPKVDSNPLASRITEMKEPTFGEQLYETARHYSVSAGEVGLRTLGAISLAFPVTQWGAAANHLRAGDIGGAFQAARNTNDVTFQAGLATIAGKFISMSAKEPDPYNPNPPSALDVFREKIAFKLSSVVEGGAASYMMLDRANVVGKTTHTPNVFGQSLDRDYFGAIGNAVFIGGYGIRFTAPYGSLDVDMPQLYAHISDCLSHVPLEALPTALLASSASIKQHFADSPLSFTEIYSGIAEDLRKHYGIDVAAIAGMENASPASNNIVQFERQGAITAPQESLVRA
jgi:hypothetical protein